MQYQTATNDSVWLVVARQISKAGGTLGQNVLSSSFHKGSSFCLSPDK
jgi:hypothetical protein